MTAAAAGAVRPIRLPKNHCARVIYGSVIGRPITFAAGAIVNPGQLNRQSSAPATPAHGKNRMSAARMHPVPPGGVTTSRGRAAPIPARRLARLWQRICEYAPGHDRFFQAGQQPGRDSKSGNAWTDAPASS